MKNKKYLIGICILIILTGCFNMRYADSKEVNFDQFLPLSKYSFQIFYQQNKIPRDFNVFIRKKLNLFIVDSGEEYNHTSLLVKDVPNSQLLFGGFDGNNMTFLVIDVGGYVITRKLIVVKRKKKGFEYSGRDLNNQVKNFIDLKVELGEL